MTCPNCKNDMTLIGVTDKGGYKYYCSKCTRFVIEGKKGPKGV